MEQARSLAEALKNIDKDFKVGELTNAALEADLEKAIAAKSRLTQLEIQIVDKRNQRDESYDELWKKVKRLRVGVKAIYGDDSSEYEMVGGTRLSERKPRTRKKAKNTEWDADGQDFRMFGINPSLSSWKSDKSDPLTSPKAVNWACRKINRYVSTA